MSEAVAETPAGVEGEVAEPTDVPGVAEESTPAVEAGVSPVESAAPPWAPSQEEWAALTGTVQQLAASFQPPAPPAPEAPSFLQTDETTGENYIDPAQLQAYINFQIEQGVNGRLNPVEPILNQTIADRGEQIINTRFTDLGVTDDARPVARAIAEGIAAAPGADPNAALKNAAEMIAEHDKRVAAQAVEAYKTTLGNIGSAPVEPGATGAAVNAYELPKGRDGRIDYKDAMNNWLARNGNAA